MSGGGRKKKEEDDDEVEKLLRATEDDILLKLSVDSHMSRGSSSQIFDPDLDLRFRALRSKPTNPASKSNQNPPIISSTNRPDPKPNQAVVVDGNDDDDDDNDLFARFAALKSSLPSYNSSTFSAVNNSNKVLPKSEKDEEEDEVDKVIRWAMDSARLDPSPTSDTDDDDDSDTSDESDDDNDIGDGKKKGKKRK